jgi:hypothetical protein
MTQYQHLHGRLFHPHLGQILFTSGLNFELLTYYWSILSHHFAEEKKVRASEAFLML